MSQNSHASSVSITAVLDELCLTVSGHPTHLEAFSLTLPSNIVVHKMSLNTLYHAPYQLVSVREQVLKDIEYRSIKFPELSDLIVSIRSTHTGELLDSRAISGSLVERVVDMLLIQPVRWDRVLSSLAGSLARMCGPEHGNSPYIRLLNFGPGTGLLKCTEKAFEVVDRASVDLTLISALRMENKPKQEPIAIVGMAVNMPGAPNTSKL